jgi:hypothetical protein
LVGVYDNAFGDPITNAIITIAGSTPAQTDVHGEATFSGITTGAITITASAPGYSTQTFVSINSNTIEFELEQTGKLGGPVNLIVSVDGLADGETGYVTTIVDGDLGDLGQVTLDNQEVILSVPRNRELSIGLLVNNLNFAATKFEVEDFEPIYHDSKVIIEATGVTGVAKTVSTFTGSGEFTGGASQNIDAVALAYDYSGTSYLIGARFGIPMGTEFSLSRVSFGTEQDDLIAGQIVYIADDDTTGNTSFYTVYDLLSQLPSDVSGNMPSAPTLTAPGNDAEGLSTTPTFEFSSPVREITPSLLVLTIEDENGALLWEVILPPTATRFELPALNIGGLKADTLYYWYVKDYVITDFSYDNFSFEFSDFFEFSTESGSRWFRTAL